ncbi:MAG: ATP phosphoribosyltransferase [Dehalococcoidia bacterium]
MTAKLALPTGDSRAHVNSLLESAGLTTTGYEPGSRLMRTELETEGLVLRIFREKDIPVQVALGNYDIGICNDVWLTEQQVRFPLQRVVRLGSLPGPATEVWLCAAPESGLGEGEVPDPKGLHGVRIVSELANLGDLVAVNLRLPAYRLVHVAGSADAYPPEDAEFALMTASEVGDIRAKGLVPVTRVFRGGLAVIANADALAKKPLASVLARLAPLFVPEQPELTLARPGKVAMAVGAPRDPDVLRLAVPDGHAQRHAPGFLRRAGFEFDGYDEKAYVRRPSSNVPGLEVKVVRPQDMPQLIAMGMFDLGISGVDLLHEHKCKFPASPVEMAVDLQINKYRIGPVVEKGFPADTTPEAVAIWNNLDRPVRVASEFPATAERFALDQHLRFTTIIPVAGASEGFVPEDADFLVEGTETGSSLRANGLKMLDPFMESSSCVIVRNQPVTTQTALLHDLVERLRSSVAPPEG